MHAVAIGQARTHGIRNHVLEEGYLRPYWITLEREGVNARSMLPRSADWYRRASGLIRGETSCEKFQSPFWRRAAHDVIYHAAGSLNPILFPGYRTHSNVTAPIEYAGFVRRWLKLSIGDVHRRDAALIEHLIGSKCSYFFLPLQLDSDAQVRSQPDFGSMQALILAVLRSFATRAPTHAKLLIKNHPLDIAMIPFDKFIEETSDELEIRDRVFYVETGDLAKILQTASGAVTLNSTVGAVALKMGCPTIALAEAVYRLPGLTAQCTLDDFWNERTEPDRSLFESFERVLHATVLVNGGFYCPRGIALASHNAAHQLNAESTPLERLIENVSQ